MRIDRVFEIRGVAKRFKKFFGFPSSPSINLESPVDDFRSRLHRSTLILHINRRLEVNFYFLSPIDDNEKLKCY